MPMIKPNCGGKISLEKAVKSIAIISLFFTSSLIALEIYLIGTYGWPIVNGDVVNQVANSGIPMSSLDVILGEEFNMTGNPSTPSMGNDPTIETMQQLANLGQPTSNSPVLRSSSSNVIAIDVDRHFKYVAGFWFATWGMDILLSIGLYIGACQKNETVLLLWFYIRCALLLSRVVCLIIYILAGITLIRKIPVIIIFIFRAYCLWTVGKFIDELKEKKNQYCIDPKFYKNFNSDPNPSQDPVTGYSKLGLLNQLEYKIPTAYCISGKGNLNGNLKYPFQFFS